MLRTYDSIDAGERIKEHALKKSFILAVVNKITAYHGKKLLSSEVQGLINYMRKLNYDLLINKPKDVVQENIARAFASQLSRYKDKSNSHVIDTHELMKNEIGSIATDGGQSIFNPSDGQSYSSSYRGTMAENTKILLTGTEGFVSDNSRRHLLIEGLSKEQENSQSIIEREKKERDAREDATTIFKAPRIKRQKEQNLYLLLDSKYRDISKDPSVLKWSVQNHTSLQNGTVNTLSDNIHNIILMQFEKFFIPYVPSADNQYSKLTLLIQEMDNQSVLLNNNRRYHMMFDTEINANKIECTPLQNDDGRFRFYTPINILDTITITFKNPFNPVSFFPDRYDATISPLNPIQSLITFSENHLVADGELIEIEGYTTADPVTDYVAIDTVNREEGHIVTFISNTTLRIDVNLTTITPTVPPTIITVFIAARRVIIPLRMLYMT